jgi:hypothetical protein
MSLTNQIPGGITYNVPPPDTPPIALPPPDDSKSVKQVEITEVHDVFTISYASNPSEGPVQETYKAEETSRTFCIDGFLNVGDDALYHVNTYYYNHPIFGNGRFTDKYYSGGRSFGNATIITVEQINGSDASTYDVILAGLESRAIIGVPPVGEGNVTPGVSGILSVADNATVKPGQSTNGIFIYAQSEGGIPVQIESITNAGTPNAVAQVRRIRSDLQPNVYPPESVLADSPLESAVPFPFRAHARVGDQGLLAAATDGVKLVFIARIPLRSE